ncbi:MAG: NAD-dependent epimerase/dehydratase family protein [Terriglobales bacterium]
MLKVLITGVTGFIGRNLAEQLAQVYALSAPNSKTLDLLDAGAVRDYLRAGRFDVIVHAAITRVTRRLAAPPDMLDRNCRMFFNLVRNQGLFGKLIYFGSGAEYDRRCMPPRVTEDYFDTHVPADAYSFSKYICAKYTEQASGICNLRLFGVFGPHEAWDVRFISNACCRVVHGLPIVIRQDVRFDYLHTGDLARLTRWFIENDPPHKAYNVCTGRSYSLCELAAIVADVSGRNPEIIVRQEGMAREYSGDNRRLLQAMDGYRFREMRHCIGELYAWYESRKTQIDPDQLRFDG